MRIRQIPYGAFFLLALLILAGCAPLAYAPGSLKSGEKSLVFGKIVLVRDGQEGTLSSISTMMAIHELESTDEPHIMTESFDSAGRFYWSLAPGRYVLNMGLNLPTNDIVSCAFTVPEAGRVYYFGELRLQGRKHFNTIWGANIRDVRAEMRDDAVADTAALRKRDPGLDTAGILRTEVTDISTPAPRSGLLRACLDEAPSCCPALSDLKFEELPPDRSTSVEITGSRGAFGFPEGKSYFRAFTIPENATTISLKSHPLLSGIMDRLRIFVPAALLLDREFRIIAGIEEGLTHPVPASLFPPAPACLAGEIDLAALDVRPSYLVLYTTDRLLGAARRATRPGFVSIPGGAMLSGVSVPVGFVPWITGRMTVTPSRR